MIYDIHERLEKYFKLQLTSLRTCQMNHQHDLDHRPLRAYVQLCVYVDLQWNVHRNRALHLELPKGVPDHMVAFRDKYGPKI